MARWKFWKSEPMPPLELPPVTPFPDPDGDALCWARLRARYDRDELGHKFALWIMEDRLAERRRLRAELFGHLDRAYEAWERRQPRPPRR